MVKRSETDLLGRRADSSLQMQSEEPVVASSRHCQDATLTMLVCGAPSMYR